MGMCSQVQIHHSGIDVLQLQPFTAQLDYIEII